ncbi:hypothetical protein [Dipodfec virus UOA04_Rod_809]|nr:hypothetical protein [Dipodfec virus UOA04_Rod_809]
MKTVKKCNRIDFEVARMTYEYACRNLSQVRVAIFFADDPRPYTDDIATLTTLQASSYRAMKSYLEDASETPGDGNPAE